MTARPAGLTGLLVALATSVSAQSFVVSYILPPSQNVVPVQSGGLIPFPATLVGTTAQATLSVTNTGVGPGTVTGIAISGGAAFALQGKPLLPATLASGQTLAVQVLYTPTKVSADSGEITITFPTAAPVTVNLSGSGTSPLFTYQLLQPSIVLSPGGMIAFPDTQVGQTSSLSVRVLNSGNASGTVSAISAIGQGFSVGGVPALPQTLAVGASLTFTINFAPTQPTAVTGTLTVNSDSFNLSGVGLGVLLTYSYVVGGTTVTLSSSANSVIFSPVAITQTEQLSFDVKNTGTLPAMISNIGVGQITGPFGVAGLPSLPLTLAPNADFHLTITFTPVSLGFSNGTLLLDTTSIPLIGSGTEPPPLPSYTISGPSGNTAPLTQPSIGLTLSSPYPVAISGSLTMTVAGTLPADPAVQFASGGRTVAFLIPANQTNAVFGSSGTQIGIQTGTVAGNVTLTPTFATQAGNVDLTPASPPSLQFTVAPAAPTVLAVQLTNISTTGFTVEVTGFATTRTLSSVAIQFATAPGFSMRTSQFTFDISQAAVVWFESTASQAFGGQFTLSIPFSFQVSLPMGQTAVAAFASVSATASNATGTSNSVQMAVQ